MPDETKIACPKCGSEELIVLLGCQKHCNGCGHDFDLVKDPIGEATRRARAARSEKSGWHKRKEEPGA